MNHYRKRVEAVLKSSLITISLVSVIGCGSAGQSASPDVTRAETTSDRHREADGRDAEIASDATMEQETLLPDLADFEGESTTVVEVIDDQQPSWDLEVTEPPCGDGQCLAPEDCESCATDCGECDPLLKTPFHEGIFKSTHNSYSGDFKGERGTIHEQFDSGVRFVELDFHDVPWNPEVPSYLVGHGGPGSEVWTDGSNPNTPHLSAWLETIADWSKAHPNHLPITVLLDAKGDLTNNDSYIHGNLGFLNDQVLWSLSESTLLAARDLQNGWPSIAALRGRILVVLSGNYDSRRCYLLDEGYNPAVAMNDSGAVVEVHDSGSGHLWYWTGQYQPDGTVEWHRHGRYDTGADPAVTLNNGGWLVEVHRSEIKKDLWVTVGKLGVDLEIVWGEAQKFDTGVEPTIRFMSPDGTSLHEIHKSENTGAHWDWQANLNTSDMIVEWGDHDETSAPLYEAHTAESAKGTVSVSSQADGIFSSILRWSTDAGQSGRIRYPQLLFVESQKNDAQDLGQDGALFFATGASTSASTLSWTASKMASNGLVRLWGFGASHTAVEVSYPATDHPYAAWYLTYCDNAGCLTE